MPPETDREMLCGISSNAKSVEKSFAGCSSAETGNSVIAAHFALELVVVCQLFVCIQIVSWYIDFNESIAQEDLPFSISLNA